MREIPAKKRVEVLRLFFEGLPYEEVGRRVGASKGSVINIVTELRDGHYPEFESALDRLYVKSKRLIHATCTFMSFYDTRFCDTYKSKNTNLN